MIRDAKWSVPKDHPDVVPDQEATLLAETFRELKRVETSPPHVSEFIKHLVDAEMQCWTLAKAIEQHDALAREKAYGLLRQTCNDCHDDFRN